MSDYVDSFIKNHKEYFKRNQKVIESNTWDSNVKYEDTMQTFSEEILSLGDTNQEKKNKALKEIEKEIKSFVDSNKKTKEALFKQENELTTSILGRLSVFILGAEADRALDKTQKFINETVNIITIHVKKCDDYLKYNMDILIKETKTENEVDYKTNEIVFQDTVFNSKIKIQEKLHTLNINNTTDSTLIKFYNERKASLLMKEPLILKREDVKEIVEKIPVDWSLRMSKEMFINMNPRDVPKWNPKKHFFDQEPVTLQFWSEEINKITHGINIGGYFMHPWMYFHLNFFRTPIPQIDGSEPNIKPDLRDNEWFFAENLKACIDDNNPNYYKKALLIYGTRRFAKALRNDQHLYYTDGSIRPIGLAKIGDEIFGSNGKPTNILGVYPQGIIDMYEVEFADGRKSVCCDEHLWTVYDYQAKVYKTLPLKELINGGWSYSRKRTIDKKEGVSTIYKYFIPINKAVEYKSNIKLPIDPYFIGLWIGDGTSKNTSITTIDEEIKNYIIKHATLIKQRIRIEVKSGTDAVTVHTVSTSEGKNNLFNSLKDLKLINNKHIPEIYLQTSVENRMELLRGLLDTDGTINKGGSDISFTSASITLATDVLELTRSLGIYTKLKSYTGSYIKEDGDLNTFYKVLMYTDKDVFKLARKLERVDKNNVNRDGKIERVAITNITKIEPAAATCIRVDNEQKEFITNDFIVTHNSVILASLAHWRTITKFNSFGTIIGGNSSDINALTSKIKTSMTFIEKALQIDILKQEWENGETTFGIKEDASNPIVFSTLIVQNLESGAKNKTQKTAGQAPSVSIYDEIGKYHFLKPYLAALPSFKTPYGFKCITVLAGTGGEADLSKDAVDVLSNPESYDLLPMDWDLLESKIDPEYITWKRRKFATFFPGQMAYETGFIKEKQTFAKFLGIDDSKELDKIGIHTTNWETNKKLLEEELEKARQVGGSKGRLLEQQKKVQYPTDPEDCFMSSNENPFPAAEAKRHKDKLISSGDVGKKVILFEDKNGKISYDSISNKELAEYPFSGGFIDAPVVLYEDLPEKKPVDFLYVGGFDDYKQEESTTDSVGSFHIYKVDIGMDKWCGRIVASIASRPDPHSKLHRQIFYLMKAYNAKTFLENADLGFKDYLDKLRVTDYWLIPATDFKSDMAEKSGGKRLYGWAPTPGNIQFLLRQVIAYCKQEFIIKDEEGNERTVLGVELIPDIGLLDEIIMYNPENNVDRITSFMSCLGHAFYNYNNYFLPKMPSKTTIITERKKEPPKTLAQRMYGNRR